MKRFKTIDEIRKANIKNGYHWFDKDIIEFFGTRFKSPVFYGKYFVTSEKTFDDKSREYCVREARENDGCVRTAISTRFETLTEALYALKKEAMSNEKTN